MYTQKDIVVLLQNKMAKKTKIDGQLCRLYGIVWVSIWSNYLSIFRLQTAGKEKHKSHTFSYWAYFPFLFRTAQKMAMWWYGTSNIIFFNKLELCPNFLIFGSIPLVYLFRLFKSICTHFFMSFLFSPKI